MKLREKFWEKHSLEELNADEWEALCDRCGKCCLNKLEDIDTGHVVFTSVACKLFDDQKCQCSNYAQRLNFVENCIVLDPVRITEIAYFMPKSCAYRCIAEGRKIPDWHPLITESPETTRQQTNSISGKTVSELDIPEDQWQNYIIEEVF